MNQDSNNSQLNKNNLMNNFLADEFENLELYLVSERSNNINLNEKFNSQRNIHSKLIKDLKVKNNDEIYKNNYLIEEIEKLEIQLINANNKKEDLIESNKKIIEKLNKEKKYFDDYKKEAENTQKNLQIQLNNEISKNKKLNSKIEMLEKELQEKRKKIDKLEFDLKA